jgi:hypothetical protein
MSLSVTDKYDPSLVSKVNALITQGVGCFMVNLSSCGIPRSDHGKVGATLGAQNEFTHPSITNSVLTIKFDAGPLGKKHDQKIADLREDLIDVICHKILHIKASKVQQYSSV